MIRARTLALAGVALLSVALLAGCAPAVHHSPYGHHPAAATATPLPTETSTTTPTATSTAPPAGAAPATTAPKTSSTNPPPPPPPPGTVNCQTSSFKTTYIAISGSAGKEHGEFVYKNISGAPCETNGYGYAQFVNASGDAEGPESGFDGPATGPELQIAKGGLIYNPVTFSDGSLVEGCVIVPVTNVLVEPPGGTVRVNVVIPTWNACNNNNIALITEGIVQPG